MAKNKSFRRSLVVNFLVATFAPLLCLGYISHTYLSYTIKKATDQNNELLADSIAKEIGSLLQNPLTVLHQCSIYLQSRHLVLYSHTPAELNKDLSFIADESGYLEGIYLIDEKKQIVQLGLEEQYEDTLDNYIGLDLSGLGILRNIQYFEGPHWSNSFRSPVSGKESIALLLPLREGRYLMALLNIDFLHSIVSTWSDENHNLILVLDETGKPVFHPELNIIEEQLSFAALQPYKEAQVGMFGATQFSLGERKYTGSTANISGANWLVIVAQPLAVANKPLQRMTSFFLFAAIGSLFIVTILTLRQSRRLMVPLNDLQKSIQAVADREYDKNIAKQPHEEFEQVAGLFRYMASAIEKREQLLEINEGRLLSLLELHNRKDLQEKELLEFALEEAVRLTRSAVGYLVIFDVANQTVQETLWSKKAEDYCEKNNLLLSELNDFIILQGFGEADQPIAENIPRAIRYNKTEGGVASTIKRHLFNPIYDGEKKIAVVGVLSKEIDYDSTDIRQLSLYFSHTWDILQKKRYERERSRLAEQLAQAQKLEAIGTLASGIAHDFNNLLMVIIGNAELAKENKDKPEMIYQDLDEIFSAGLRARDLVNQILTFSRNQTEGRKPLDIRPLVKEAVKLLRSSIPANVKIQEKIAKESYPVITEPGQINQVIMNLCTNAYQALEGNDGELEITLKPIVLEEGLRHGGGQMVAAGEYMLLAVRDSGKGIREEDINRIFEPYYSTKEKERGTGLGLAVVHGIAKGMKGIVTVDSEVGKGSTFKVYLPVAGESGQGETKVLSGSLPGGNERILYVDNDEAVAKASSKLLESLGYSVNVYQSGNRALAEIKSRPDFYDLVITDLDMPEITGDILAKRIFEFSPELPVILCTGYSEAIATQSAREKGIAEVMMKPLTKLDLALTVRKVLGFR